MEGKEQTETTPLQRVKVYRLNEGGKWDDKGTGHVTVSYLENSEDLGLFVIDEEDNDTLLVHRISTDDIYRRQEDTIISWRDQDFSAELALSFQEKSGCSYVWDHICAVQRNTHFRPLSHIESESSEAALETSGTSLTHGDTLQNAKNELREFPSVALSTLPLVFKMVMEGGGSDQLRLVEFILLDDFFVKLVDVFRTCEDLESIDELHMIFKIVKGIIMLNSTQIFEKMFADEVIMDIIGCLEYDPDLLHPQNHRAFFKEHVVFKEAIPIKDSMVLSRIHQTYRIGYIKDVILARALDEAVVANFTNIIHGNNAVVVSLLKDDSIFIQELFARLKSPTISDDSKKNLVMFLQDFCSLSKSLQLVQHIRLFRDLVNEGIFDVITDVLQSQDKRLVLTGTDILLLFLNQDPNLLRTYVIQQDGNAIFGLLVNGMLTDFGDDMHCQFVEIIRILLDSYSLNGSQKEAIVDIFYEKYLEHLLDVIVISCSAKSSDRSSGKVSVLTGEREIPTPAKPEILLNICDLLCFCVVHHPYRTNFLLHNVIEKVLHLIRRREKYLGVSAVRFMRTVIARSDDQLLRHIGKNNLLKPIVEAFVANGYRYNLLHSAILELFDLVRRENLRTLVLHIVENFWNQLAKFEDLSAINAFKIKYDQLLETVETRNNVTVANPRSRLEERALDKEEEDYFNEDSDEEDSASAHSSYGNNHQLASALPNGASSRAGAVGLVDYEDDDDDEDYNLPSAANKQEPPVKDGTSTIPSKFKRRVSPSNDHDGEEVELTKRHRSGKCLNARSISVTAPCSASSNVDTFTKKTSTQGGPRDDPRTSDEHESKLDASRTSTSSSLDLVDVRQTEQQVGHSSEAPTNSPTANSPEPYSVH